MDAPDYQVFARRFRPATFAEVVGQEAVTTTLDHAVARGRIAHAYLFAGPRGVGKTSVARILAKALNCAEGPTVTPCGVCANCRAIAAGVDTDVLEIDGASNSSVEDIRKLWETIQYAPGHSAYKIYIIDEVHSISGQAFNALLKTLEEPPHHTVFVFATTRLDKVPETIASRCQRFIFRRIGTAEIEAKLARIAADEGLKVEPSALALLARRAGGSMRDAESLFDQVIAFAGEDINRADVERTLGLVAAEAVEALMAAVLAGDGAAALKAVDELAREGADLTQTAHQAVEYLRDLMVLATAPEAAELVDVSGEELARRRARAAAHSPATLLNLVNVFLEASGPMARVFPPRLVLEYAALKAARIRNLLPIEDLLAAGGEPEPEEQAAPADAAAETLAAAKAAEAEPAARSLSETWEKIKGALAHSSKREEQPLLALLQGARPIELTGGELRLGYPPAAAASAAKVNDAARRAALGRAVSRVLGRDITVTAEVEEGAPAPEDGKGALFGDMPLVAEIQKRYQGQIVEESDEEETPDA